MTDGYTVYLLDHSDQNVSSRQQGATDLYQQENFLTIIFGQQDLFVDFPKDVYSTTFWRAVYYQKPIQCGHER